MTKQQHKLINELRKYYSGITRLHTSYNLWDACTQAKLAEFCRTLQIGVKKYKWEACRAIAAAIHAK